MKEQLQNLKIKTATGSNLWEGEYQMSQVSFSNDETQDTYEKKIRLSLEVITENNYHFLYSEFDYLKNGEDSDTKVSNLSKKCMEIIYPVCFIVSLEGKIQKIELIKSVQQISLEMNEMIESFEDNFSSNYIEDMKEIIKNPKEISEKFEKTLLVSFLFNPIYKQYFNSKKESLTYTSFYPWISNANPILFEIQNIILDDENSVPDRVKITQKGISTDYRTYEELYYLVFEEVKNTLAKENSINCEFIAEYIFDKENKSLQRIEATFQNFFDDNIEKKIFILERLV